LHNADFQQNMSTMTANEVLELARAYQPACILAAAADLDLFQLFGTDALTADQIAVKLRADLRGTTILLDALVALRLLEKNFASYRVPTELVSLLGQHGPGSVLAMAQHQANCLRRWAQLAQVVKTGQPAPRTPSIRGEAGDLESFIGAMHNVSAPEADKVIRGLHCRHLLDVGGGSGTWTLAFLRANPGATATIFDLPAVIPMARQRLAGQPVQFVAGDFYTEELPGGADLAWVSAIVHQNSRAENRELFARVYRALVPGGRIAIRDIVMEPSRTAPVAGALFAVNMLVGTENGGTFTFDELREDLESAGFRDAKVVRPDAGMNAVTVAVKSPAGGADRR
jgi:SAM-dependent methyltransferase